LIGGGARNERRRQSSAKVSVTFLSAGRNRLKGRNGINGRGPPGGKDAVYAGSDLEPIAPRAPGRAITLRKAPLISLG